MVAGIGRSRMLAMLALGALAAGPEVVPDPGHQRRDAPPPPPDTKRQQRLREERAWERRERKRRDAEMRERLLRQKIAEGKDDRPDKYLHAAARRRRAAEAEAPSTRPLAFAQEA